MTSLRLRDHQFVDQCYEGDAAGCCSRSPGTFHALVPYCDISSRFSMRIAWCSSWAIELFTHSCHARAVLSMVTLAATLRLARSPFTHRFSDSCSIVTLVKIRQRIDEHFASY
ncbi:hypothetical protein EYF80_034554 [Liparis tanakae]|uniref:Uncharacterized protein n=1 Tax=Liparis tanakae TaxID=230148 RepID=A0A4Z2GPI6_9TELE|nr:hypothetical protein EYF80_034554 [Liparis tanakae]